MRSGKDHGAGADGLEGKLLEVLMREEAETIREAVMQAVAAVVSSPAHPASVDEPQSPSDITWAQREMEAMRFDVVVVQAEVSWMREQFNMGLSAGESLAESSASGFRVGTLLRELTLCAHCARQYWRGRATCWRSKSHSCATQRWLRSLFRHEPSRRSSCTPCLYCGERPRLARDV